MIVDCLVCGGSVEELVDLGLQPICNRYLASPAENEERFPLRVAQCTDCGTVQRTAGPDPHELVPPFDWIEYWEPEGHLDELADRLAELEALGPDATVAGLSYKDDSLLERLEQRGFPDTWRLTPGQDIKASHDPPGVEIVQDRLDIEAAEAIVEARGTADLLVARHILEHAFDPLEFMAALQTLVSEDGYVVFEVPDCERALSVCDYTTIWEEHLLYLTEPTYRSVLESGGFEVERMSIVPYSLENSMLAITRLGDHEPRNGVPPAQIGDELERGRMFGSNLDKRRSRYRQDLEQLRDEEGPIAMLGAGHLGIAFVNYLGIDDLIEFVADDDPNKQGLYTPGCHLPILPSKALADKDISLCLLSVNPEAEQKVVESNQTFRDRGGRFRSIFPASEIALELGR